MNSRILLVTAVSLALSALAVTGCSRTEEASAPSDAPGGGRMGGPGGRMGGPGGGRFAAVAATATASEIFGQKCQGCHGVKGQGQQGPSLLKLDDSDAEIRQTIQNGRGRMPAFGNQMSPAQIDSLIAHVRKLGAGTA